MQKHLSFVLQKKRMRVLFIEGDPKSGKTELVKHFIRQARSMHQHLDIHVAVCQPNTQNTSFDPFIQLLVRLVISEYNPLQNKAAFKKIVKEVIPAWLDLFTGGLASTVVTTTDAIYELVYPEKPDTSSIAPANRKFEYAELLRYCENHPCVLVIDDFHWADAKSLHLLNYLVTNQANLPILFVLASRPATAAFVSKETMDLRKNIDKLAEPVFWETAGRACDHGQTCD